MMSTLNSQKYNVATAFPRVPIEMTPAECLARSILTLTKHHCADSLQASNRPIINLLPLAAEPIGQGGQFPAYFLVLMGRPYCLSSATTFCCPENNKNKSTARVFATRFASALAYALHITTTEFCCLQMHLRP